VNIRYEVGVSLLLEVEVINVDPMRS